MTMPNMSSSNTAASGSDGYFGGNTTFDNGDWTVNLKGATATGSVPTWAMVAVAVVVGVWLWKKR